MQVSEDQKSFVADNDISIIEAYTAITGNGYAFSFGIYDADEMFPLSTIKFESREYPCPKNPVHYLEKRYPDFLKVPQKIDIHDFHHRLLKTENVHEILDGEINRLKEINKNFK